MQLGLDSAEDSAFPLNPARFFFFFFFCFYAFKGAKFTIHETNFTVTYYSVPVYILFITVAILFIY